MLPQGMQEDEVHHPCELPLVGTKWWYQANGQETKKEEEKAQTRQLGWLREGFLLSSTSRGIREWRPDGRVPHHIEHAIAPRFEPFPGLDLSPI